jgi:intracellular sulfur oxidation DsrE/DsrF family protein
VKAFLLAIALALATAVSWADPITGVVVQGNGDQAEFERALKLASNMHEVLPDTKFEVVIFGPAVKLLEAFSDEVPLIQKVQSEGVRVIACGRSLKSDGVKEADLAPGIAVVPFGAVYILERQKAGWQYFKP